MSVMRRFLVKIHMTQLETLSVDLIRVPQMWTRVWIRFALNISIDVQLCIAVLLTFQIPADFKVDFYDTVRILPLEVAHHRTEIPGAYSCAVTTGHVNRRR